MENCKSNIIKMKYYKSKGGSLFVGNDTMINAKSLDIGTNIRNFDVDFFNEITEQEFEAAFNKVFSNLRAKFNFKPCRNEFIEAQSERAGEV